MTIITNSNYTKKIINLGQKYIIVNNGYISHFDTDELIFLRKFLRSENIKNYKYMPNILEHKLTINGEKIGFDSIYAKNNLTIPNGGGPSELSESMSMDIMSNLFNINNIIFETHVKYEYQTFKVDYLFQSPIFNNYIAVSATRAFQWELMSHGKLYDEYIAERHIEKKISSIIKARNSVCNEHYFDKAILHIFCENYNLYKYLYNSFQKIAKKYNIEDSIICILSICNHKSIYNNDFSIVI